MFLIGVSTNDFGSKWKGLVQKLGYIFIQVQIQKTSGYTFHKEILGRFGLFLSL